MCTVLALISPLFAQSSAVRNERGVQYGKQKMFKLALKEFNAAIEIYNKKSAKLYHNKGWVLELKGDFPEAIKSFEEAIRRDPMQLISYEHVGHLYQKTGAYTKAVKSGEFVLKHDPNNKKVPEWLPGAYKMSLKQKRKKLLARKKAAVTAPKPKKSQQK